MDRYLRGASAGPLTPLRPDQAFDESVSSIEPDGSGSDSGPFRLLSRPRLDAVLLVSHATAVRTMKRPVRQLLARVFAESRVVAEGGEGFGATAACLRVICRCRLRHARSWAGRYTFRIRGGLSQIVAKSWLE